ncbi:unnamed protein product [Protopolystoma xenopodis]|uniref:UTP--glucose-1-phosphate uridylyltransferase n=1 Tax=Protopolystoma xenopodis TaxID=117903 RepID=A0A3S5BLH0_9PLAT|nr:unnamed protein product [Protopolystoma xenopodis]
MTYPRLSRESLLPIPRVMHHECSSLFRREARCSVNDINGITVFGSKTASSLKVKTEVEEPSPANASASSACDSATNLSNNEGWYPPGHGDIYRSFLRSSLADEFRNQGKEWLFISNIDNLGATVDLSE